MIAVNPAPGNEPVKRPTLTAHFTNSAELTSMRVMTLLNIVQSFSPKITVFDDDDPISNQREISGRFDGGPKAAAEATFMNACDRLDKLLADDIYWTGVNPEESIADKLEELKQIQVQIETERLKLAHDMNRPCRRLNARVARGEGTFIAYLGNLSDPGCVGAEGSTIEEAMTALDAMILAKSDNSTST